MTGLAIIINIKVDVCFNQKNWTSAELIYMFAVALGICWGNELPSCLMEMATNQLY